MSIAIKPEPDQIKCLFQTCRLCLSGESVDSVFNGEDLEQWISDYLSIRISPEDRLSQAVCSICRIQLMEFHQFRERCHEVQNTLKSTIYTEHFDSCKKDAEMGLSLENQDGQLHLESLQNVVADELVNIKELIIEADANIELSASADENEYKNGAFLKLDQAAAVQIEDSAKIHQSVECEICHKTLHSQQRLNIHKKVTHGPQTFKCVTCKLTFVYRRHYDAHLKTKRHLKKLQDIELAEQSATNKEFQCNECPESFPRQEQLLNHNSRMHKSSGLSCPICQKLFVSKYVLIRHVATLHGGENRPYECDICQSAFKIQSSLQEHHRRVHGPKRHCCHICGFRFTAISNFTRHMGIHKRNTVTL